MNRNKLLPRLIWISVCIGLCILLADHFLLRDMIVDQGGYSAYRIVTPPATVATQIHDGMPIKDVVRILGQPNASDPLSSVGYVAWDLQLGHRLWLYVNNDAVYGVRITLPFASTRWLIFPGIMLAVGLVEAFVYFSLRKKSDV